VETPPNVLIVMIDDLGWGDLSANPEAVAEAHTPHLDRLADEGVFFSDAYVTAPTCSASRAGFNTGMYQNRWDKSGGWRPGLPSYATTLAERLRANGYVTGKVGKNDFGTNLTVPDRFSDRTYPANHGYDRFLGFTAHAHDYWFHEAGGNNVNGSSAHAGPLQWHDALVVPEISPQRRAFSGLDDPNNLDEDPDQYYLTDLITDEALNFLQEHGDGQDPFFLHVSYNAVHHLTPQVPEKYLQMEAARLGWDSYPTEAEVYDPHTNTQSNPSNYHDFYNYWNKVYLIGAQAMRRYYQANLRAVDENMGRLLDALDEAGLADNTLVFFFGDNGGAPETGANNGPLMGSKYNVFEGGIRIPFMARWPRILPAGNHYPYVVSTLDVLPTVLEAAGIDPASGLDGVSLLDAVLGNRPTVADPDDPTLDARTLFWRWQGTNYAVRRGPWKLVDSQTGRDASLFTEEIYFDYGIVGKRSLFNLDDSVSETAPNDRIAAEPGLADELQALYDAWVNSL
jgi:arylsulfatase A-like enzyme